MIAEFSRCQLLLISSISISIINTYRTVLRSHHHHYCTTCHAAKEERGAICCTSAQWKFATNSAGSETIVGRKREALVVRLPI